jgi:hypothetical protein
MPGIFDFLCLSISQVSGQCVLKNAAKFEVDNPLLVDSMVRSVPIFAHLQDTHRDQINLCDRRMRDPSPFATDP